MKRRKRKVVVKTTNEIKKLLIALLIGDGTISNNYVFKLSHCIEQEEFLKWKLKELDKLGIKNNGLKTYVSSTGYNEGSTVLYSQMSITPTIKALRRSLYKPKKTISKSLLNWLDEKGLAIWYMDDGSININSSEQRNGSVQRQCRIATCENLETVEEIIDYFKTKWDIQFIKFLEGKNTYSIITSTLKDTEKFINIVKPYVQEIPSMLYKIRYSLTKKEFIEKQQLGVEMRDYLFP